MGKIKIDWESKPSSMVMMGNGLEALSSAKPQAPNLDDLERWKRLYKPPFKFDPNGTTIFDADNNMACQVRGWGRISHNENPEAIQDAFGHKLAEMITALYSA